MNITAGNGITTDYVVRTWKSFLRFWKYRRLPKVKGGRCFILGNGPSLTPILSAYAQEIQREHVFCVNMIVESDVFQVIKPKYYCCMDPASFRATVSPSDRLLQQRVFAALNSKTHWEMHVFFPFSPDQIILEEVLTSPHLQLHMCNTLTALTWKWVRNYVYLTGFMSPPVNNVLNAAIFLSLNMGYKEIILLGADHSWTESMVVRDDNILYLVDKHFSGTATERPWRFPARVDGRTFKVHEAFFGFYRAFRSYWLLKEYASFLDAKVYNATPGSYIDAFERRRMSDIWNKPPLQTECDADDM